MLQENRQKWFEQWRKNDKELKWKRLMTTCHHIFRGCIALCSHHSCWHMSLIPHRTIFGKSKIRKFRIVILEYDTKVINRDSKMEKIKCFGPDISFTASRRILDVLKSLYITGLSISSWRKASPFAASRATLILIDHGSGTVPVLKNYFKKIMECDWFLE